MQNSIGNLGAVLGTQLYRTETAPTYYLGHGFALGYLVANLVVVGTLWLVLKRENIRKEAIDHGVDRSSPFSGDDDPRWRFHL